MSALLDDLSLFASRIAPPFSGNILAHIVAKRKEEKRFGQCSITSAVKNELV